MWKCENVGNVEMNVMQCGNVENVEECGRNVEECG